MSERMRFGLVGTGYWAREVHAAGIASHPEAELVGVWGRHGDRAQAVADRYDARRFDDLDAMIDAVDAVAFAVPPDVQVDVAVRAASAGRHLLLEKPLATEGAAAEHLVDAVEGAHVSSVVFFTERFIPEREVWLEGLRRAGSLGGEATLLACLQTPGNPFGGSAWRKQKGALWDIGPHALSVLLPVLGPVSRVVGARGYGDLVHLVLTHDGGATSTVRLSLTMPPAAELARVEFYTTDGWQARPEGSPDIVSTYRNAVGDLVEAGRAGRVHHRCDVRFARDVVAVLESAERELGTS